MITYDSALKSAGAESNRGRGRKKTVVLIHGWASESATWEPLLPHLSRNFHVLAVDLAGHGKSPSLKVPHTIPHLAQKVLDDIHGRTNGSVILIGHSMGANVAVAVARMSPVASHLILIDPAFSPDRLANRNQTQDRLKALADGGSKSLIGDMVTAFSRGAGEHLVHWAEMAAAATPVKVLMESLQSTYCDTDSFGTGSAVIETLGSVRLPTLIVQPAQRGIHPWHLLSHVQVSSLPIASHFLHMERPADVLSAIVNWMEEVDFPAEQIPDKATVKSVTERIS